MNDESFITEQDIEALKAKDERWRLIDIALKVDDEIRNSIALNLILEAANRQSIRAKELLIDVSPSDIQTIMTLQVKAQCAKLINDILTNIRNQGLNAQTSIEDEGFVELEREQSHG